MTKQHQSPAFNVRPFKLEIPPHLQKLHEAVEWYYTAAESEMGISSNWGVMVAVWAHATTQDESAEQQMVESIDRKRSTDQIFKATNKYSRIAKALDTLSASQKAFLLNLFYEKQYDKSLEGDLGRTTHVVAQNAATWGLPPLDARMRAEHRAGLQRARRAVEAHYVETLAQLVVRCTS